jgi:hypothetical protein
MSVYNIKIEGTYFRIKEEKKREVSTAEALQTLKDIEKVVRQRLEYAKGTKDSYSNKSPRELDVELTKIAQSISKLHKNESEQTINQIKALVNSIENLVSSPLLQLPGELIVHILSFLKISQIWTSFSVSKDIYACAQTAENMRRLEYGCTGMSEEQFFEAKKLWFEVDSASQKSHFDKKVYDYVGQRRAIEVSMLLECGADPNGFFTDSGDSALILAAHTNNNPCVSALLKNGANVNHSARLGMTALHWAVINHNPLMVKELLECGADPNFRRGHSFSILEHAVKAVKGNEDCIILELLVNYRLNLKQKFYLDATVLHYVARREDLKLVKFFLDHGADPTVIDKRGMTPLQIAEMYNPAQEVVALLRNHKIADKEETPSLKKKKKCFIQ